MNRQKRRQSSTDGPVFGGRRPWLVWSTTHHTGPCSSKGIACHDRAHAQVRLNVSVTWLWRARLGREQWFRCGQCTPSHERWCCAAGPSSWPRLLDVRAKEARSEEHTSELQSLTNLV